MFCEKSHSCNSQPAHIKKIKLKNNFDKNQNKKKNYMGKYRSNSQYFKEKNYKAKFLTSLIL
jgi:hypothetical protein